MFQNAEGKLRDKAVAAAGKGKFEKALGLYQKLEKLSPTDGSWARKSAEMSRSMGDTSMALESYTRASLIYAEQGFLVKAVAMCKIILRMDPDNRDAQEQLAAFNAARGINPSSSPDARRTSPPAAADPPTPVDAALEDIDLGQAPIGSVVREQDGEPSGVTEILLDDEDLEFVETTDSNTRNALVHTPIFSALSAPSLHFLIDKVRLVELPAGETLFEEGDTDTTLYVVSEGKVLAFHSGPPEIELAELGDGEFFGEISLITNQPRIASVRALVATELLAIDRQVIGELIATEPTVLRELCRFLRERLVENLVKTNPLFSPFAGEERQRLISHFQFLEVESGSVMLTEGELAPALFVVMSGCLDVKRQGFAEHSTHLTSLGRGDVFGEMSLLGQSGAVATVVTTTKCLLLELPAKSFREVIMTHPRVLAFVGDLAASRERQLAAVARRKHQE